MVSETKLGDTFPISQFLMQGYPTPFRKDRTSKDGGILLNVREDIPCKIIKTKTEAYHKSDKSNNRPISILPNFSRVYVFSLKLT